MSEHADEREVQRASLLDSAAALMAAHADALTYARQAGKSYALEFIPATSDFLSQAGRPITPLLDACTSALRGAGDFFAWSSRRLDAAAAALKAATRALAKENDAAGLPTVEDVGFALSRAYAEAAPLRPEPAKVPEDPDISTINDGDNFAAFIVGLYDGSFGADAPRFWHGLDEVERAKWRVITNAIREAAQTAGHARST